MDCALLPIFTIAGAILVCGAYQRWQWLVDPNVAAWPFYSQSFIKRFFGKTAVLYYTYFVGLLLMVSSCWLLFKALLNGCHHNPN